MKDGIPHGNWQQGKEKFNLVIEISIVENKGHRLE